MQFRDLQKQYQVLKNEINEEIEKVLIEGNFVSGTPVAELEEQLAKYVDVKHCISCANGTDALSLALIGLSLKSQYFGSPNFKNRSHLNFLCFL